MNFERRRGKNIPGSGLKITGCCFRLHFEHIEGRLYFNGDGVGEYTTLNFFVDSNANGG